MSLSVRSTLSANVVGSGPNGLAAAIVLARAGLRVRLWEGQDAAGGATRSGPLTLPGFVHDLGSAIHPLAISSPFFRELPLHAFGLRWIQPDVPLAHPLPGGATLLHRSLDETADGLGEDGPLYRRLMAPLVENWDDLMGEFLRPLLHLPAHPILLARFGIRALPPVTLLAKLFRTEKARALLGGLAAHSTLPLTSPATTAFGLMLGGAAHARGWPFPQGGAGELAAALVGYFKFLGGEITLGQPVQHLRELPTADITLLDVGPPALLKLAEGQLPERYAAQLRRFQYGPGAFKVDYALSGPLPWADSQVARAGTVHLGGDLASLTRAEAAPAHGKVDQRPYVLLAQHTLFDPSRAPAGQHTVWAYTHVPNASSQDALPELEAQIERSAPGFSTLILQCSVSTPATLQAWNPNLVGGDVGGGANSLGQLLSRPVLSAQPYRTPVKGVYLCSASTPPGGGVHGMAGYWAARLALRELRS
ncbi:NAD(P)/FAD-dependent oxidoreductase [Deinococcus psychrotolerans]|uniref:NAD(P)/FAD-dependent oxidoreductase n=1 Tax=Deinococcus psychrotolerans TaxID=2489213 RepID=A0A3G8YAD4_9DEIO|nr:NAD(P)/FAD-dependent oxidoreductase [Deinococcus psychrotolerans]AZI42348.1 NAD(P)/FAD-dependent oxidoreductase [Deinococcus psychrotolerans]